MPLKANPDSCREGEQEGLQIKFFALANCGGAICIEEFLK